MTDRVRDYENEDDDDDMGFVADEPSVSTVDSTAQVAASDQTRIVFSNTEDE